MMVMVVVWGEGGCRLLVSSQHEQRCTMVPARNKIFVHSRNMLKMEEVAQIVPKLDKLCISFITKANASTQ